MVKKAKQITKGVFSAGGVSVQHAAGIALSKRVFEGLLTPVVGNQTAMSGISKIGISMIGSSVLPASIKAGLRVDGWEDVFEHLRKAIFSDDKRGGIRSGSAVSGNRSRMLV